MKSIFTLLLTLILSINVAGQSKIANPEFDTMLSTLLDHTVTEVSPSELTTIDDVVYLDTRAKKEYEVSHIKGARWIGFKSFNMNRVNDIPKNRKIVVYCTVGYRSEKIAEKLVKAGYTDMSNLYGGIFEWVHHNQPIHNNSGPTQQVHTFDKNWGQWLQKGIKIF